MVRDALTLTKPKVTGLLTVFGVSAALVADPTTGAPRLALFALLGAMAAGGAATLNHVAERDIDGRMQRTRRRPVASGRVSVAAASAFAALLLAPALVLALVLLGPWVAFWMALGAVVYAGLYTHVLKRRSHHSIVIGGAAGSCGALAGWALVDPGLAWGAWWMAALVFLWTPPHFWGLAIARDGDYRAAEVPMLPQVRGISVTSRAMLGYALAALVASLALAAATPLGVVYTASAAVLGLAFTALTLRLCLRPDRRLALLAFTMSGLYLLLLLVAVWVDLLM